MLTLSMDALSVRGMRNITTLAHRDAVRRGIHSINRHLPGINSVVISSQQSVSCFTYASVSRTGPNSAEHSELRHIAETATTGSVVLQRSILLTYLHISL
jgi:hypothetical protein